MEIYMPQEMLAAGVEALKESRDSHLDDEQAAITVYLAMQAVWEILKLKNYAGTVH